jgi:hypothetical protein
MAAWFVTCLTEWAPGAVTTGGKSCYHAGMRPSLYKTITISVLASLALAACSPPYNWRDYSSPDAPFRVMFPDKPATHTRSIDLNGMKVDMTMTAAQVDGTMFAVGTAEAPDADQAEAALAAMKTALVKNIGATIKSEKAGAASAVSGASQARSAAIDIDARGVQNGEAMRLVGHFESRNKRFYQVIVMGKEKAITKDNLEMFMSSFKLQ